MSNITIVYTVKKKTETPEPQILKVNEKLHIKKKKSVTKQDRLFMTVNI